MIQAKTNRDPADARPAIRSIAALDAPAVVGPARPRGKLGAVLAALETGNGAGLAELMALTGWQPQTVRAALSKLRRRGFAIRRAQPCDTKTSRRLGTSRFVVGPEIRPASDLVGHVVQLTPRTRRLAWVETGRNDDRGMENGDRVTRIRFDLARTIYIVDPGTACWVSVMQAFGPPHGADGRPPR